ncbi:hypothetical protein TTHERM_000801312 (macronuclear) [Tetrahymena thermophila SB210]|uniref:Transmembrane protein n=1 Tax=Tetrahymena thermophila (strain SB210) TaxID=312017 RepID=W7XJA5_TETTS|nr:hypothetical protein TTHERM_000801312 [Tetrahymena thermophila SB210]EWS75351.1 hypothetical protein TTHERM_000801312 [Tetrahymena thermophila SB210]|eukprot:XP_012652111.1 hypothetical protein TTHERM_000801312 [Tetrahymena thermophila SB210]
MMNLYKILQIAFLLSFISCEKQQIEGPNQSQQQTSLNISSDQQVDKNFQTSRNDLLNNISSTIRITQQSQANNISTLNGFSVSNQSTVQLAQGEIIDNFYYSETLQCFFVITEQQNFIYFNPNATDISQRQQLIFNVSQRKDDKKFIRKFYYSETYKYMIVLFDNQPTYMFNNFNQNLFSGSSSLSSLIEVYMFSVNSENMIKVQFQIQVSEILTGATLMSPIIDFSVSSDDIKFMYLTNQNIQVYETNILGNIQFYPTFNLQNTNSQNPFSNGFSKLYFSQNLIIIMNNLQGLICYRIDTKLWYAGIITYTNPTFQFIYLSKTFFIFFGTNIQQGSLTTFQLVLQDTPVNKALNSTNISLFSSIPLFITISQNFMLAVLQSSTVAIYQIVDNNSSLSQFNFVLSQTLQIQQNIIQLQMTSYALIILNYKQLSIFSRIDISTPVQTNYVSLYASQNVWQTSSNAQQASFCAFYNNIVYILSSSSIFISSQNQAVSTIPVANSNPIILFGVFAYPLSYYYLDSKLNLQINSMNVTSNNQISIKNLNTVFQTIDQVIQTFQNIIFIKGSFIQPSTISNIMIIQLDNTFKQTQLSVPNSLITLNCTSILYSSLTQSTYFTTNTQIYLISQNILTPTNLIASLIYDFSNIIVGFNNFIQQISVSQSFIYVILNYGIIFYELNIQNNSVRQINIPFNIGNIFPFNNFLVLTNPSQIVIFDIVSNNVVLFKSINQNNNKQITCADSYQSSQSSYSVVQSSVALLYNFQNYQPNLILKLVNNNSPPPYQLGSQLTFQYYMTSLQSQILKLSYIQQDQGLVQTNLPFVINQVGNTIVQTSDLLLNTIGGNVVEYYTTKTTNLRIESAVLIFGFIQKVSSLLLPSTVQSLQSIGQITNDGYIVLNGLQSAFKILSLPQSEQSIIMNSIIRVHYLVQIQETLQFDELNLLAFTTSSKNVQLSFNMKNNYYQFILKNIYTSEVSENLNWEIVNNSFGLIIQGAPSNIQKYLSYFMIKPVKQSTVPSQETINILFSDFLNSSKNITLKLQDFLNNNLQLFKQVEGLKLNQSLQTVFNQIYDYSNLKIDNIDFSIPDAVFQDSDIPKNSHLSQQSILQYQEKNKENIIYYYYHTTQKGDLDLNQIQVGQNSIDYLSSYNGVAISQNNFMIDTNNFREKGLLTNKIEYHRIIICAQNEINQICDDIEFTLGISNTLDILLIVLTPIGGALAFYWIYQRYYVIKFFYNMNKITFSDEKVYSNNHYHKQIPIITDQFEIAKELWSIYKVIRIDRIEQRVYQQKLNFYDDEENITAKMFEQNIRKTSDIATTQQGSGQNNQNGIEINQINIENNLGSKVNSSKKIELSQNSIIGIKGERPQNQKNKQLQSQSSHEYGLNMHGMHPGGISTGRQTSSNNLKQAHNNEENDVSKNATTPDNSIIRTQLNQELKDCSFSNAAPINQEQIANPEVENNDQFSRQNPNLITLNSEQNSPTVRSQFYRHNNHNHSIIRENNIDQMNMSFFQSQLEKSDSGGSQSNPYQSYQEFIYKNKKIQLVQANGNIITNQLKEPLAESQGYLSFTKYQGPLLSSYQASQLQVKIEQQKIEDDRNQLIFQKCFQENNIQFNKTNSFIVRDLINNSRVFNQKVYDLWKNMQVVNPVQLNDTPENPQLLDNYDSPRSNRQTYKKNASSRSILKKIQLQQQKKNLVILSKNVNEQVEKIKGSFSKLIRDQLDLKDQVNKRLQNLKEENIIDDFSGINEDILLNDIKKTLTGYLQTKIQQRLNVSKFKFLLNQVQTITNRKDALSRYLFVECARHILSIDSISKYIYDYLKKLALLYNNSNDWYKSYLFIIGHNQDNQIYPFPSIVVKDDMVQQAFFDLGVRFSGKEAQYKEKIKIVGQALVADALDLNKFSNNCGESLYLSPDDQILSIRAINIPEKSIGGKMRQFKNFVSWMIGNFDKQQLLNNMYIPEWMSCDITYNTVHIKGNPNNSQVGRYLIIISGKRKHILRSFILKVLKSNSYNQSHNTQSNQIRMPFESDGNLFNNSLGKNQIEVQSPYIGIKQDEIKQQQIEQQQLQQQQPQPQPLRLKSKSKGKQKEGKANSDQSISGNKYLPKTKSLFQKSTLPLKSSSYINSPKSYKSTIQVKGEAEQPRLRGFSEYVETNKYQIHHQDKIARPKSSQLIEDLKNNQNNLKPVSEEENNNESSIKSSFISENRNIFNQIPPHLDHVIEPRFFPNSKDISVNMFDASSNDLQTQRGQSQEDSMTN